MENNDLGMTGTPEAKVDPEVSLSEAMLQSLVGDGDDFQQMVEGELFSFSFALIALRRGHMVARNSWRIPGKYVILQPAEEMFDPETGAPVQIKEHLIWKNAEGKFVPWTASQDAILARDWFIGKSGDGPRRSLPSAEPIQN